MKRYEVKLTTIGPVHVGSGEILNKSSYIYDKDAGVIHIPDQRKMMKWIMKNKLDISFENYFMSNYQKNKTLYDWIKSNNLSGRYKEIIAYSLPTRSLRQTSKPINDIALMVKDKENNPYIPGSSLKGAIRTMLFAKMFEEKDKRVFKEYLRPGAHPRDRIRELARRSGRCEKAVFYDAQTENKARLDMSGLLISDSHPLSKDNLILAQKIDRKPGRQKKSNALPIYRESIKPGVEIKFEVTIKDEFGAKLGDIEESIREFYSSIDHNFLVHFDVEERDGLYMYLGGGTGFQTKTVIYPVLDDGGKTKTNREAVKKILDDRYPRKGHGKANVSPQVLKETAYQNKNHLLEMGLCSISFQEVADDFIYNRTKF